MKTAVDLTPDKPPKKIKSIIDRRADHESGLNLKASCFRVNIQTPEANVQHRCVCGRIRDGPIEILHFRVPLLCGVGVDYQ